MTLSALLALARKHLGGTMESSARLCLADAVAAKDRGDFCEAIDHAQRSLRYSIGILHPDYRKAFRCEGETKMSATERREAAASMLRLGWMDDEAS